ncbi:MAG: hypothetical protein K9M75_10210 [Phycisphaerae bacterium]|nr:hypothetical protein [Phycisphaerae bacterium]
MSKKRFCFVIIVLAVVFCFNSVVLAADTREINVVFGKAKSAGGALNGGDKKVIGDFVSKSIEEMIIAPDYKGMAGIRGEIVSRSVSKKPSQYSMAFAASVEKAVKPALAEVARLSDKSRMLQLKLNLLILLAQVESMELAPVGMSMFDDENAAVRYWAVNSVANSEIANQLKSKVTGDEKLAGQIISRFDKMVDDRTLPEILNLIVGFADALDTPQADALLVRIADIRIKSYAAWKVKFELMDADLLNSLARSIKENKTGSEGEIAEIARRFGQLYSYAIQRYISGFDTLQAPQKDQLAFVLADVEQSSISKLLGRPQNVIKQCVSNSSQRSLETLGNEHDSLLGKASGPGLLGYELKYDYGQLGGKPMTAPMRLTPPDISL